MSGFMKSLLKLDLKQKFFIGPFVLAGLLMSSVACEGFEKGEGRSESKGLPRDIFKPKQACNRDMEVHDNFVTRCNWNGKSFVWKDEVRLAKATEVVMRDLLNQVGLSSYSDDLHVIIIPKEVSPTFNMILSYKWHSEKSKYVNLIQIAPHFEGLDDDSILLLALVHEVGHMRQYLNGDAFPADILIRECSKLSDVECERMFPSPSFRLEDNADDFMLNFVELFPWQNHSFNPYRAVEFFKNFPDAPQYRSSVERARLLKDALFAHDVKESAKTSREILKRLDIAVGLDLKN